MIQLKPDCLVFQTSDGEQVPCSAEWITLELMGEGAAWIDPQIIHNVSAAVLHYFKNEQGRDYISVGEFAVALEKALRGFGLSVYADCEPTPAPAPAATDEKCVVESNLQEVASAAGKGFELVFFPNLREEVKSKMEHSPDVLRFRGLRGCVKQLTGAERWTRNCQHLNDQIVDFLRGCWQSERGSQNCSLVVL
jgi:hypothetical protein